MSDLRTRIAAVLLDHELANGDCCCEQRYLFGSCWETHVADAIIRELGLREETAYAWNNNRSRATGKRYVTDWRGEE